MVETSNNLFQNMRATFFSVILLFFCFNLFSRTIIRGTAPAYKGMRIELRSTADYISETTELLSSDQIAEDGSFVLYSDKEASLLVKLVFEKYYSLMYLESEQEYQVEIPEYTGILNDIINERYPVNLEIKKPVDEKLNRYIVEFNREYDEFIKSHFMLILRRGAKNKVDTFKRDHRLPAEALQIPYYRLYTKYSYALLDLISSHSKKQLYENYLQNEAIAYQNEAYMKFFNEFYKDFFKAFYFVEDEVRLILSIENHQSIDSLDLILKGHAFLKRDDIRELVMIKELYFNTANGRFKEKDTRKMLIDIRNKTENIEHKAIIDRLLAKNKKLALGTEAPAFSLPDRNGKIKSLSDFRGKYVYLDFWATWCAPCLKSMIYMHEMYPKYKDSIEFVSVSIDKNFSRMERFLAKEPYEWTFLHYDGLESIKEDYRILAIPSYFFIDPQGNLIQTPALHPESGIERFFKEIVNSSKKDANTRFWEEKPAGK